MFLCEVRQQKLEYAIYIAESDFTKDWNVYAKIPQLTFLRRLFKQQSNGVFKYKFPLLWNAINNSQKLEKKMMLPISLEPIKRQ